MEKIKYNKSQDRFGRLMINKTKIKTMRRKYEQF